MALSPSGNSTLMNIHAEKGYGYQQDDRRTVSPGYRAGQEPRPITETELLALLDAHGQDSVTYYTSQIAHKQRDALRRYDGEPYGDEIEGKSRYVDKSVSEVIDWMMPDLIRMFMAGDRIVEFAPSAEGDEDMAEQATDYCNWIFWTQNRGFNLVHDWFKTALLQKLGVLKVDWEDSFKEEPVFAEGIGAMALAILVEAPDTEILAYEVTGQVPPSPGFPDGIVYDVNFVRRVPNGKVIIEQVPPEEMQISRRTKSLETRPYYIAHWPRKTRAELLEMGYAYDLVMSLKRDQVTVDRDGRENQRWREEDHGTRYSQPSADGMTDEVLLKDEYVFCDLDGDGMPEYVNVLRVDKTILEVRQVSDHPFVGVCPVPMPFRAYGKSIYEDVNDIQRVNTVLVREQLNNVYAINNGREAIDVTPTGPDGEIGVNMDDILNQEPGTKVRVFGNPVEKIMPLPAQPLPDSAYQMIDYMERVREGRTGVSRSTQGLDADTLNEATATAVNRVMDAMSSKKELIGRIFAETGFSQLFRKMLKLSVEHQDFARVIRLRGKWVPMDPRTWNADMDVIADVGLGSGNKDQMLIHLNNIKGTQEQILTTAGVDNPIVTLDNYYNTLRDITVNAGLKAPEKYFSDPSSEESQQRMAEIARRQAMTPPPENPLMEIERLKAQVDLAQEMSKREIEQMKAQVDVLIAELQTGQKAQEARLRAATQMQSDALRNASVETVQ